jgi:hypothetical protein
MKVEQIRERVTSFIILSVTECPNAAMIATTFAYCATCVSLPIADSLVRLPNPPSRPPFWTAGSYPWTNKP